MNMPKHMTPLSVVFISVLVIGGILLLYKGSDAVAMGKTTKAGIVTAEQVNVSFDSVQGRLLKEAVKEGDMVQKGDVLMVLDSTDVDLSLAKTEAQIAQLEAQIASETGTIRIGYAQADTTEEESRRSIDGQRAALVAAEATRDKSRRDYERMSALFADDVISRSEMDASQQNLDVAEANVIQQQQALAKLLGGAADTGDTNTINLPAIAETRAALANKQYDVASLVQQKKQLEITRRELLVQKDRLVLRAPENGKILKLIAKEGEMISPNTPVILLESSRYYYDIYVSELQASHLYEGKTITGHTVSGNRDVSGTIRLLTQAPGFADLKMTREKGQSDLSAFQVRIYTEKQSGLLPGMTVEVPDAAFTS